MSQGEITDRECDHRSKAESGHGPNDRSAADNGHKRSGMVVTDAAMGVSFNLPRATYFSIREMRARNMTARGSRLAPVMIFPEQQRTRPC